MMNAGHLILMDAEDAYNLAYNNWLKGNLESANDDFLYSLILLMQTVLNCKGVEYTTKQSIVDRYILYWEEKPCFNEKFLPKIDLIKQCFPIEQKRFVLNKERRLLYAELFSNLNYIAQHMVRNGKCNEK